jgi:hypothetical protein
MAAVLFYNNVYNYRPAEARSKVLLMAIFPLEDYGLPYLGGRRLEGTASTSLTEPITNRPQKTPKCPNTTPQQRSLFSRHCPEEAKSNRPVRVAVTS